MVAFGGLGVEEAMPGGTRAFTVARWIALIWVLTWFPLYTWFWGWKNMMHLCDVSVVIACLGLWFRQSLLVSSQALLAPLVGVVWSLDVLWRIVTGHHLIGGTEYMWDTHYALWLRLLSCFHIGLPVALLWALQILGYDRRALPLQTVITGAVLIFSRFLSPELNMNFVFQDPLLHRGWGPAPEHLTIILAGCIAVFFWPTHLMLLRAFPSAPSRHKESVQTGKKGMATDSVRDEEEHEAMLQTALREARVGLAEGGIPIGAALFTREGKLLGKGHNRRVQQGDPSAHGETDAFRRAGRQRTYRDKIMVTTLAPCWYCSGLIRQFGIGTVVVGESVNFQGAIDWLRENGIEVIDLHSGECIDLLAKYVKEHPEVWKEDIGEE